MSRLVAEPGWRWSEHVRPSVGEYWCRVHHVGFVVSGRLGTLFPDGREVVHGPDDIVDIPPGHDGYAVGDEPCVQIFWAGNRPFFASFLIGSRTRVLATLLFTDLVDSTAKAAELGDARWRALLSDHFVGARAELEALRRARGQDDGRRVPGDLSTAPGRHCGGAAAIRGTHEPRGLQIRAGVHVGEVECRRRGRPGGDRSRGGEDHGGCRRRRDSRLRSDPERSPGRRGSHSRIVGRTR